MKPSPIFNCTDADVIRKCMNVPDINEGMLNGTIYELEAVFSLPESVTNMTYAYCSKFLKSLPKSISKNKP